MGIAISLMAGDLAIYHGSKIKNNFTFQKTFQAEDQSQIIDILARLIQKIG